MKYLKSILAGVGAMILISYIIPMFVVLVGVLFQAWKGLQAGGFGISGHWAFRVPTLSEWLLLLSSFGLGYCCELRRIERQELLATLKRDL